MAIISDYNEADEQKKQPSEKPSPLPPETAPSEAKEAEPKQVEENKEVLVPNKNNGLDIDNYSWGQSLQEITISVSVPSGTKSKFIVCDIKRDFIRVGLKNQDPIIEGELFKLIKPQDSFWSLEDQKTISLLLTKVDQTDWWESLIKGGPQIDNKKMEPPPTKIWELDGETKASVEKMLFDQRQRSMGLPTSDQIQKEELMKKLKDQFPNMDFSGKNFTPPKP